MPHALVGVFVGPKDKKDAQQEITLRSDGTCAYVRQAWVEGIGHSEEMGEGACTWIVDKKLGVVVLSLEHVSTTMFHRGPSQVRRLFIYRYILNEFC